MKAPLPDETFEALARGATIITPNERAARGMRRAWDQRQHALGHTSWASAAAVSWQTWLNALWRDLLLRGVCDQLLLSSAQEHLLWVGILREDTQTHHLLRVDDLAGMCARGYRRLHTYDTRDRWRVARGALRGDPAAFARWIERFEMRCGSERLLPAAALPANLTLHLSSGGLATAGREILLFGFDTLLPSQEMLLAAWNGGGGVVSVLPAPRPSPDLILVEAADRDAELRGFARWARNRLAAGSDQSIALVVADLAAERDEIETVLRETLSPELEDIRRSGEAPPFELSLGRSLRSEPLIRAALDLLQWTRGALSRERIERLLLGPAIGDSTAERAARAALDEKLRRELHLSAESTIDDVVRLIRKSTRLSYPLAALHRALDAVQRVASAVPPDAPQSFAAWADFIRSVLLAARWNERPGSRSHQLQERWEELLDTLATLDFAAGPVPWSEVSETLGRLAQETVFAPQSRDAPVQVLGPSEAAGSQFDALWVLRCAEMEWPPAQSSHPLLPASFEHAVGMPGADRERDRQLNRIVTARLAGSASQVIFSFANRSPLGARQGPSAELAELSLAAMPMAMLAPPDQAAATVPLEGFEDTTPLPPLPTTLVRGGARVLELQAQCPFRAFAELRLHTGELRTPAFGLSPLERGNTVHVTLEKFWHNLESQAALRALSPDEQTALLSECIDLALAKSRGSGETIWTEAYLQVQRQRLHRLLRPWLQQELLRPEFTVSQQETKQTGIVGPLELSLRVDRVDLVDGVQVLLDYKTGPASATQWRGDRPDRPQLPLYAVHANAVAKCAAAAGTGGNLQPAPPLGAVAFARVVLGKDMKLEGFERDEGGLLPATSRRPSMEVDSFAEQVERWAEILARLATEFAMGDARVDPKQFPATCSHCGQRLLCRVNPARFEDSLEDPEGADQTSG